MGAMRKKSKIEGKYVKELFIERDVDLLRENKRDKGKWSETKE